LKKVESIKTAERKNDRCNSGDLQFTDFLDGERVCHAWV
jgi:hypothetical protein